MRPIVKWAIVSVCGIAGGIQGLIDSGTYAMPPADPVSGRSGICYNRLMELLGVRWEWLRIVEPWLGLLVGAGLGLCLVSIAGFVLRKVGPRKAARRSQRYGRP